MSYLKKLLLNVPCGHCSDCLASKAQDYNMKCIYALQEYVKAGGYAFFDTLTYNNACLPKKDYVVENTGEIITIPHFSSEDITHFFKRLKINLKRAGYAVKDNLSYMLTCEYGGHCHKENNYVAHRPHYHVIFFCKIPHLDSYQLKFYITKSWKYGFTDSIYHVKKNTLYEQNKGVMNYITKYVTKKDDYVKYLEENLPKEAIKDEMLEFRPFVRITPNLGLTEILKTMDSDLTIPMSYGPNVGIIKKLIPAGYRRRLCNDQYIVIKDGKEYRRWKCNEFGLQYRLKAAQSQISRVTDNYTSLIQTSKAYDLTTYKKIIDLLGNRPITELVKYDLFYKGCYLPRLCFNKFSSCIPSVEQMIRYNCCYTELVLDIPNKNLCYVTENSSKSFTNFDRVLALLHKLQKQKSQEKLRLVSQRDKIKTQNYTHYEEN